MQTPETLFITEIFHSLQGETSRSGLPFVFVRLTGCNLRCTYCDSAYAFHGGTKMSLDEITERVVGYGTKNVLLTGGEPLLQKGSHALAKKLSDLGFDVSFETHGEISIEPVVAFSRIILDVKTPGSGMSRGGFLKNLPLLNPERDEVKFVLCNKEDFDWAADLVTSGKIPTREILFSRAIPAKDSPGTVEPLPIQWVAEEILKRRLNVRFQMQLHKEIWGADKKGV